MAQFEAAAQAAVDSIPEEFKPYLEYKRQHEQAVDSMDELVAEVRQTILHEVGHHFGMEEDELPY